MDKRIGNNKFYEINQRRVNYIEEKIDQTKKFYMRFF